MKRFLSLMLTLALLLSCLSIVPTVAEEVPTLTWLMYGNNTPNEDNSILRELEARLGVKIKVIYVPNDDLATKLNSLIAIDDLPDIYLVNSASVLQELKDAGKLLNFGELLPEYGPDILASAGDELKKLTINTDGVYGLVRQSGLYLKNFAFRKDWLAKVGMEMPTDLDSLYDVLYAFTYNDPDGNGQDDTYGFVANMTDNNASMWQHIMAAFDIPISFTNGMVQLEDGTVTTFIKHPRFMEAMNYLRRLYQDGIMDPDFATLTQMQCFERLWQGKVGCLGFQSVGITNNWYPGRYTFEVPEDPADLFGFAHINNKGGTATYPDYTTACAVINANCKYPELAVKAINYIYYTQEGQELTYMGIEGVHFNWIDKENGKYERLGIYTDDTTHRADGCFVYNGYGGWSVDNAETRLMNKITQQAQAEERAIATQHPEINAVLETRSEYGTALDDLARECFATLIVTADDAEAQALYEEFVERWNEEGGLEFEEEATAAYAEQLAQQQ